MPRQARYRYANGAAHLLISIREQLKQKILKSGYVQVDETFTKLIDPERWGRSHDAYLWGYLAPREKAIVLEFSPSRSGAILHEFFPSHWDGDLQSDGARMYPAAFRHRPKVRRFGCMAHYPMKWSGNRQVLNAARSDRSRMTWPVSWPWASCTCNAWRCEAEIESASSSVSIVRSRR